MGGDTIIGCTVKRGGPIMGGDALNFEGKTPKFGWETPNIEGGASRFGVKTTKLGRGG